MGLGPIFLFSLAHSCIELMLQVRQENKTERDAFNRDKKQNLTFA